ncbi:MAG TPA: integrase [Deltaproteobacteria bacterium]|nr:integrase [Deltaproteobacteria bacterium]
MGQNGNQYKTGDKQISKRQSCKHPGVRYREHPIRKHGVRPDRYFIIRLFVDGKSIEEGLGWSSEGWTEIKAATLRAELVENKRRGEGPRTLREKRDLDNAARREKTHTVEEIIEEFWEVELSKQKSGADRRRILKKDVASVWSTRRVADIKRRDIVLLLDNIEKRSKSTRNHVHSVLSRLFNFAAERGIIEDSPCTRIRKPKEKSRSRVLSDEEIKLVWAALDTKNKAVDIYVITKLALKTILLTGQRSGEVCGMTWEELTPDGFWTIPAGRMKEAETHTVPLCPMAREVIEEAETFSSDCHYVFRSSYKDASPVTRAALSRAVVRHWKIMGIEEPFTPHDLRRTLRTRLAELGVSDIVAEKVIGHKLQGMLAVYNRHGYDKEKRDALKKWEKKLRLIVGLDKPVAAKVIKMKG